MGALELFEWNLMMELLEYIHSSPDQLKHTVKVKLIPEDKFISGWIERELVEQLSTGDKVKYDEWEVEIETITPSVDSVKIELKLS